MSLTHLMSHSYLTDYDNKLFTEMLFQAETESIRLLIGQRVCSQNFRRTRSQEVA